jgi:hypothetical protein
MSTIEKKRDFLFKIIVQHGSRSGFGADAHGAPRSSTMVVVGGATDTEHAMPCPALGAGGRGPCPFDHGPANEECRVREEGDPSVSRVRRLSHAPQSLNLLKSKTKINV